MTRAHRGEGHSVEVEGVEKEEREVHVLGREEDVAMGARWAHLE